MTTPDEGGEPSDMPAQTSSWEDRSGDHCGGRELAQFYVFSPHFVEETILTSSPTTLFLTLYSGPAGGPTCPSPSPNNAASEPWLFCPDPTSAACPGGLKPRSVCSLLGVYLAERPFLTILWKTRTTPKCCSTG